MKRLLVIYHSQSGNTERMAQAVVRGARHEPEVEVAVHPALEAGLDELLVCDALLIGTPEYNGYMAGAVKDFLDRTYYPAQEQLRDQLPYGMFVSAGNDGTNAVRFVERIARGYPLRKVVEPLIAVGAVTEAVLDRCEELGHTVAAGLTLGLY